jgi:hypothetical protein
VGSEAALLRRLTELVPAIAGETPKPLAAVA